MTLLILEPKPPRGREQRRLLPEPDSGDVGFRIGVSGSADIKRAPIRTIPIYEYTP